MITWDKETEQLFLDGEFEGAHCSPALWERIDALQKSWHAPDGHNEGKGSGG